MITIHVEGYNMLGLFYDKCNICSVAFLLCFVATFQYCQFKYFATILNEINIRMKTLGEILQLYENVYASSIMLSWIF